MLLVAVLVVLANVWVSNHFFRLDLTRARLHSLDEASKRIVGALDKPLTVRVYFTHGLEAPYNNHEATVHDKLEEMRAYSGGKMQITSADPVSDRALVEEAQKYGLTPLQYTVRNQDRAELRSVWMGAVLIYADKTEVLPAITNLSTLEYDLAAAIHRLQQKDEDKPIIAYSIGHGEPDLSKPDGPMRALVEGIGQKAWLVPVELGGEGLLHEKVTSLLVIGPQEALPERALYQIDQFVMRGGSTAIFLTHTRPDMRTLRTQKVRSGLEPLVGHYGVQVNQDVVFDRVENGAMRFPVRVGQKTGTREVNFPMILRATALSGESVLTSGLDSMLFPFASSVRVAGDLTEAVKAEVVARSAGSAGGMPELKSLDPGQFDKMLMGEARGPFDLAVAMVGSWRSFYETRPAPAVDVDVPDDQEGMGPDAALTVEGAPTRMFVAGSADMVANNQTFMLNLCDWLMQDEALIGIRSKTATVPELRATTAGERSAWRAFNLAVGPVLLFAFGAFRRARARRVVRKSA
jgi:gliding-associated putative ABC transporter substrate-binding component GldG